MLDRIKLKLIDDKYLDKNGCVSSDYKFKLNFPEFNIKDSIIIGKPEEKFETKLFLPIGEGRKGEGGLRTKGYFKFSYKYVNNTWMIADYYGNTLKNVPDEIDVKINEYISSTENSEIKELPLITVITVVYNGEKYLEQTIQSVINQTYPNVEYIIIDGGSTDGTIDLIKKYEDYIDYWVSEKDKGIYDAMNKGIEVVLGQWLGIIGSDDWYELDAIENFAFLGIAKIKDISIFYGNTKIFANDIPTVYHIESENPKIILKRMISHPSSIVKFAIIKNIGFFNISFKIAGDYDLFIRIYINNLYFKKIPKLISNFRSYGTSSNIYQDFLENFKIYKMYKNKLSPYFLPFHIINFVRAFLIKTVKKVFRIREDSNILKYIRKYKSYIS